MQEIISTPRTFSHSEANALAITAMNKHAIQVRSLLHRTTREELQSDLVSLIWENHADWDESKSSYANYCIMCCARYLCHQCRSANVRSRVISVPNLPEVAEGMASAFTNIEDSRTRPSYEYPPNAIASVINHRVKNGVGWQSLEKQLVNTPLAEELGFLRRPSIRGLRYAVNKLSRRYNLKPAKIILLDPPLPPHR